MRIDQASGRGSGHQDLPTLAAPVIALLDHGMAGIGVVIVEASSLAEAFLGYRLLFFELVDRRQEKPPRCLACELLYLRFGMGPKKRAQPGIPAGTKLVFAIGSYFAQRGVALADPPFLKEIVIRFGMSGTTDPYHIPLLVTP
jgi:hypothetical protein